LLRLFDYEVVMAGHRIPARHLDDHFDGEWTVIVDPE
jgi:hypothetical protein